MIKSGLHVLNLYDTDVSSPSENLRALEVKSADDIHVAWTL